MIFEVSRLKEREPEGEAMGESIARGNYAQGRVVLVGLRNRNKGECGKLVSSQNFLAVP